MDEKHIVENYEKILNILLEKFSDEERVLLLDNFNFSVMCALISSEEHFENYRQQISEQIGMWNKLEKLLVKLNECVKELPNDKSMIDKGISIYEKLNRQERLEFNKRMSEKNTLENSLDTFGYSWDKFVGKLLDNVMKNTYNRLNDLLKDIRSDIENVLANEVLEETKDIVLEHVEDDVFNVFSPKIYERRSYGGLDDGDNIIGNVQNMELPVENITKFNDDYGASNRGFGLPQLVNDGDGARGYYYDYPGNHLEARPFLDNAQEEINRGKRIDDALERGLKNVDIKYTNGG